MRNSTALPSLGRSVNLSRPLGDGMTRKATRSLEALVGVVAPREPSSAYRRPQRGSGQLPTTVYCEIASRCTCVERPPAALPPTPAVTRVAILPRMAGDQQSYMAAAAQIVPVLVLALLADPTQKRDKAGRSTVVLAALGAGVVGEGFALGAIGQGTTPTANLVVTSSMVFISFAIILPHAKLHTATLTGRIPPFWRYAINRIFELVVMAPALILLLVFPIYPQMWVRGLVCIGWLFVCYSGFRAIQSRRRWYRDNRHNVNAKSYTVEEAQAYERQDLRRMAADMGLPAERLDELGGNFRTWRERRRGGRPVLPYASREPEDLRD